MSLSYPVSRYNLFPQSKIYPSQRAKQPKFQKEQYKGEDHDKSHCHSAAFRVAVMFDESRFPVFAITDERENERKQEKESIRSDYRIFSQKVQFIYKYRCRDSYNKILIYTQNKCTAASHSFLAPLFTLEIQVIEKIIPVIISARHLTVALEIVIRFIYTFHIVFTLIVLHVVC